MTDEDVVRWLHDTYGGKFYVISRSNGYKTVYKWRATGALAVELLAEVRPYLGARRGNRADAALEHNNMRGK